MIGCELLPRDQAEWSGIYWSGVEYCSGLCCLDAEHPSGVNLIDAELSLALRWVAADKSRGMHWRRELLLGDMLCRDGE